MPTTRRQFIKRGAGMVSLSLVMPKIWLSSARAQAPSDRKILVVIQLSGGNDGLNTLVPYADSNYFTLRPDLSFRDTELKDDQGRPTLIDNQFGLHPSMGEIKGLYDTGKVAIVNGVGYPSPNLSHFLSKDIWSTANLNGGAGNGWLGKYADQSLVGKSDLSAVNIGGALPKAFFADKVVVPSISNFANYTFQTDPRNQGDRFNQLNAFNATNHRTFPEDSFLSTLAGTGVDALAGAQEVADAVARYTSTVTYPSGTPPRGNQLATALKMAAQLITTVQDANLLYVEFGGFDTHSLQIGSTQDPENKLIGDHAALLSDFSEAVKAFYDDMAAHGLAENVVLMEWSEFGRRPQQNASFGSDHGTSSQMFIIGDPVHGGVYGQQPSLSQSGLDGAGNMVFNVDFRAVYATILDKWLGADSQAVLGSRFENVGFLG
ncbi:MAG TPA: DUF1501 domain-containing protein [Blastocatellia bacterium]|nr:DUF1501 domain-containing protein [Blastocatellia bacterium]